MNQIQDTLWFDVGIKRYTTSEHQHEDYQWLWFDVGIKRYTTFEQHSFQPLGCGLM